MIQDGVGKDGFPHLTTCFVNVVKCEDVLGETPGGAIVGMEYSIS